MSGSVKMSDDELEQLYQMTNLQSDEVDPVDRLRIAAYEAKKVLDYMASQAIDNDARRRIKRAQVLLEMAGVGEQWTIMRAQWVAKEEAEKRRKLRVAREGE